jgi:hypothetical protein
MKLGKNENIKKGILFFLGFCLYGFFAIFVFGPKNISVSYSEPDSKSELRAIKTDFEYREVVELKEVEIAIEAEEGEVLGVKECGKSDLTIEAPQLFCDTQNISERAEVVMAEIYAPTKMFSGSNRPLTNVVQVNDKSNSQEDEKVLASRNAAEVIRDVHDFDPKMVSGDPVFESVLAKDKAFEPFGMHFGAMGKVSKTDFFSSKKSDCLNVNTGEHNVKNSNVLQDDLTCLTTPPGLMALGDRDYSGRLCREPTRQYDFSKDDKGIEKLCSENLWTKFKNLACGAMTIGDKCDGFEGVLIDAPLGSTEVCNEEDCSIRYWESARLINSPPNETKDMTPSFLSDSEKRDDYLVDDIYIFTTPCKVRIDCKICETKCYWDVSVWQHIFSTEEFFSPPAEDNWDKDDWWDAMVEQIKNG